MVTRDLGEDQSAQGHQAVTCSHEPASLPPSALLVLASATSTLRVGDFVPAGCPDAVATALRASPSIAGQLVGVFGVVHAVSAPLPAPAAPTDRRHALVVAMNPVSVARAAAPAFAPSF
jgi:predicted MFS family arabinose efflux permease